MGKTVTIEKQNSKKRGKEMKFVTCNIRGDFGCDGDNNFCYRKPLLLKKFSEEKPDIICFQEVMPHVAAWLKEALTDYYVIGCGRSETLRDEQAAIAYRKDRMNLMKMDSYWLSETPDVPASRYPDQSPCPRICTEAVFEDLEEEKVFRVVNTHLDHEGQMARRLGLEQIMNKVKGESFFGDVPVILTGDFNAEPDWEEMQVLKEYPEFRNVTEKIGITYHGFTADAIPTCIDFIIIRGSISCRKVEKWTDRENGVYLSDHYPVCAELVLG